MVLRRAVPLFLSVLLLAGCGAAPNTWHSIPVINSQTSGSVHGGQQPIVGATIQLYTVGTTADASPATPLLTSTVTSDSTGSFTITGLYSCTSATQVYIVATGGNPGLSTTNPDIALMAALGPCSSLTPSTFINIDELTTVAAVSALAPFMHSATTIGSSSSDAASLASAFSLANQFVNTTTGLAPGNNIPTGYTDPIAELNTLADIVSACINSTGGTAGDGSLCGQLFTLTTISPNPAPTNTIAALLNLANNPTQNTAALFALTPPTPPFQPTLTAAPSDFLIALIPPAATTSLEITPASISFPDTAVNTSSQPFTITLQNTGSTSISLTSMAISGTNSSDFSITNPTCGSSLNAGALCSAQIVAKPSASGARSASFVVTSSAPNSPQSVSLTIKGTIPTGSVTLTSSASFTILGALQDLTLSNQNSTAVNIASVTETDSGSPAWFTVAANTCGTSLAAQSSCTISVVSSNSIAAPQPTTLTGTLTVTDDAGTQTAALNSADAYQLLESPYPHPIRFSSGVINFPTTRLNSPENESIYYTPLAFQAVAPPLPLTFSGADPSGDFVVYSTYSGGAPQPGTTCPDDYVYGEECEITLSFRPTAAGQRSAKLSLDASFGTPTGQYILLQGTGLSGNSGFLTDLNSLALQSFLPSNLDPRSTGAQTITVTNIGITALDLSVSVTGTVAPYLTASAASCTSVNPGATCQIPVTFSATATGTYTGSLTITNPFGGSATLPITATTAYWPAVATPGLLNFGSITVGTPSVAQKFVIADPNGYPLGHAYTVALQPSSNFELTQGATCPASTTQTCTLAAAFAPQTTGNLSEAATITDQTTGLTTQLALFGTGSAPTYTLSTTGIVFPTSITGVASTPIAVTLTATGTQPVSIASISITGDPNNNFSQTNNCSTVTAPATCTINITFTPASTGTATATLQIAGNGVNSPTSVSLSGSGASPSAAGALQFSPTSVSFPSVVNGYTAPAQIVTVTNTTSVPVTITSTPINPSSGATFAIISNDCIGTLKAGGSCTIAVTGTSTAEGGATKLVINSTTPGAAQSVQLSILGTPLGSGTTGTTSPSSFTYTIWGANKDYTVTNSGTTAVAINPSIPSQATGGEASDHYYLTTYNGCSSELFVGASCTFGVQSDLAVTASNFPDGIGGLTGQLTVTYGSGGSQTIPVTSGNTTYLLQNGIPNGTVSFSATSLGGAQTASLQLVNAPSGSPAASLTIGGANPGDFSVSALEPSVSSTPSTSCPGTGTAACTITVTFKPTAVGTRSAEISLDSGGTSTGQYIYVAGLALPAGPSFTTNTSLGLFFFSYLPAGNPLSTVTQTFTVTNSGTTTLNLAAMITGANAGSFTADTSQCQSVAPQATCPVTVAFTGNIVASLNAYAASLFLYDQSSSASATIRLAGSTSYTGPTVSTPAIVTFPTQPVNTVSAPVTFTVNGYGDPVILTLQNNSNFVLPSGSSCPAGSQPCTLSIAFSPQTTGTIQEVLSVTDTVTRQTTSVPLSGTAQ